MATARREFLKAAAGLAAGGILGGCTGMPQGEEPGSSPSNGGQKLHYIEDPAAPASPWAVEQLRSALAAKNVALVRAPDMAESGGQLCILAGHGAGPLVNVWLKKAKIDRPTESESSVLATIPLNGRTGVLAYGADLRGVGYALTELADRVTCSSDPIEALAIAQPIIEKPANKVRSIMRLFASDLEDKAWFNDKDFWRRYLNMLAWERFNRFNLALGLGYDFVSGITDAYFQFAYPFLLAVPGYDVRVSNLPESERDQNLRMLQFMSSEAAARGLHFQLGIWTHAYRWVNSPNANHVIEGLTPENHPAYCRDALAMLLKECPAISGVTMRIHGESGVPEGQYAFWKTVFDGVVQSGRRVEIDMHAKGMDQGMIDVALATGLPVKISPKFWAEHMGLPYCQMAIRPTEVPKPNQKDQGFFSKSSGSRSFLRYGYGDLLKEDRKYGIIHRIWPGTQRLLLWGDPVMAAAYGKAASFCGSDGVELFEPLSFKGRKGSGLAGGRDGYADDSLKPPGGDWEKYVYEYRLWGRLLYNPETRPEVWRRQLWSEMGAAAGPAELALASASRILPLVTTAHCPSAANNNYWPEIYTNMSIVDASHPGPYGDTPSPKRFGTVSPLDPELFSRIDDFAGALLSGNGSGKYSPAQVAAWLDSLAREALDRLREANAAGTGAALRRLSIDTAICSHIGRFFAAKFRAAALYAIYLKTGSYPALWAALGAYRSARQGWAAAVDAAGGAYVRDIRYGMEIQLRGHWADRLPSIDQDIARMEALLQKPRPPESVGPETVERAIKAVLSPAPRPTTNIVHTPPASFIAGKPVDLELRIKEDNIFATVWYRHVDQAESYQVVEMQADGERHRAQIPADYVTSTYPLEYYFELRNSAGHAWLHPGFNQTLSNQPYFVVRRA